MQQFTCIHRLCFWLKLWHRGQNPMLLLSILQMKSCLLDKITTENGLWFLLAPCYIEQRKHSLTAVRVQQQPQIFRTNLQNLCLWRHSAMSPSSCQCTRNEDTCDSSDFVLNLILKRLLDACLLLVPAKARHHQCVHANLVCFFFFFWAASLRLGPKRKQEEERASGCVSGRPCTTTSMHTPNWLNDVPFPGAWSKPLVKNQDSRCGDLSGELFLIEESQTPKKIFWRNVWHWSHFEFLCFCPWSSPRGQTIGSKNEFLVGKWNFAKKGEMSQCWCCQTGSTSTLNSEFELRPFWCQILQTRCWFTWCDPNVVQWSTMSLDALRTTVKKDSNSARTAVLPGQHHAGNTALKLTNIFNCLGVECWQFNPFSTLFQSVCCCIQFIVSSKCRNVEFK